jgi:hypothetical protein
VPLILDAVTRGASAAVLAYLAGVLVFRATPLVVDHAVVLAWIGAAAGVSIAARVTGRAQEWI